ncbi:MAG: hypothetical protein ACJ76I_10380 [Gaiellaceae bacterium]
MVSRGGRAEPIARWVLSVVAALWVAGSILVTPFGCAVGEFEANRDCSAPAISVAAAAVLVAGIGLAVVRRDRRLHWLALAAAVVLAGFGWADA